MISFPVIAAVIIAAIGWIATIRGLSFTRMPRVKRWFLIPLWIPWIVLALGAFIASGGLPLADALNIGGAVTAGLTVSIIVAGRR